MERLQRAREFEAVLACARPALVGPCFVIRALSRPMGNARLGIIVSRKVLANAVDRNRAKRMVRETFRAMHRQFPPADVVIRVRSGWKCTKARVARRELAVMLWRAMLEQQL